MPAIEGNVMKRGLVIGMAIGLLAVAALGCSESPPSAPPVPLPDAKASRESLQRNTPDHPPPPPPPPGRR